MYRRWVELTRLGRWVALPLYPVMLSAAIVLSEEARTGVAFGAVIRPLLIAVVIGAVFTVAFRLILGNWLWSGLAASSTVLMLRSGDLPHAVTAVALAALVAIALILVSRRFRVGSESRLNSGLNLVAAMLLVLSAAPTLGASIGRTPSSYPTRQITSAPDIYVLLLDGYPRADELERNLGVSDQAFLDALAARGIEVSERAVAEYMYTAPSLVSFFGLGRDEEILATSDRTPFTIGELINDSPGLALLRGAGYRINATVTRWEAESLRSADRFCTHGVVNEFELRLVQSSLFGRVLDLTWPSWKADRDRSVINAELECASELGTDDSQPSFNWIHVGGPHLPVVFSQDGGPADPDVYVEPLDIAEGQQAKVDAAYEGELSYLQSRTLAAIDTIDASSTDPIIIVMSDHGSWLHIGGGYDEGSDLRERFGTLFAARVPGYVHLFPDDVTVSQALPMIANTYLGADIEVPSRRFHFSWPDASLDAVVIPDPFETFGSP